MLQHTQEINAYHLEIINLVSNTPNNPFKEVL